MSKRPQFSASDVYAILILFALSLVFFLCRAQAKDVRKVKLDQNSVARIYVTPGRSTILSFPSRPSKVILGNQGVFAIEYVENDIAIAALSARSQSDLFVYLEGRRFAFDLVVSPNLNDTIVLVRDAVDEKKPGKSIAELPKKPKNRGTR